MTGSPSRRTVLASVLGAGAGAGLGAGALALTRGTAQAPTVADPMADPMADPTADPTAPVGGPGVVDPHGPHQAGIATPAQAATRIVAFDLLPGTDAAALGRLMRVWTPDVRALMQARPTLGDRRPWLATDAARLTVTVGVGPRVLDLPGLTGRRHPGLVDVPAMTHDRLESVWSGGDLVLQVGADDAVVLAHAVHRLVVDAAPFATVRWTQSGFWQAAAEASGRTGRNLFGQPDGTANPVPGSAEFDETVWVRGGPDWLHGGTTMVVRRIRLELATWDRLGRTAQEAAIGRRLDTGAPLGAPDGPEHEHDPMPLDAVTADGAPVIAADAHVRLAHPTTNGGRRLYRRGHNYLTEGPGGPEHGLLFVSFQRDVGDQFVPIQRTLDASDALNAWTTTIGSAVFAVLPGFTDDTWLGQALLTAG